jgi:hypothetical protein
MDYGNFVTSIKSGIFTALFLFVLLCPAYSLEIQGVKIPPQVEINGEKLALNGAGLRTVTLLIIPVKAYVAAFYSPTPLRSETAVIGTPGPMQFTFTFLKSVNQNQVAQAWRAQFHDSVTFTYEGYEKDRDTFISMFGPLQTGGVEIVRLIGNNTLVYDGDKLKGSIAGRNFQRAFLSLWFGSNPVMPELKTALLGSNGFTRQQP